MADANQTKKVFLEDFYHPSEEVRQFIFKVYEKYIKWNALKNQNYKQFGGTTLNSYLDDARKKFWGYIPLSYDTDTPQFFFPETRNQIIKMLSKIANLKSKPSFEGVEGFDIIKATVLRDFFQYWSRKANRKLDNFWQYLYNIINGTVIVFTAYNSREREVKRVTLHDPHTGKTEYKKEMIDESDVKETIVNLEDFFIPKLWEPNVQEQEECIWRTLMKFSDFKNAFEGYDLVDTVVPGTQFADMSIFSQFLSYDVRGQDFVEVIKYFNVPKDQYAIIANGVLLNPIVDPETGEEKIAPLPWNHKKLPFSKTIFEPIDATFFYGMPLAEKVKSPQEALNKMWELLIDREDRAVAAPILTNDPSVEVGLEFKAGRVYQVQADPTTSYRELQMQPTSASYFNAMTMLNSILQSTGSGGVSQILPTRQPRSASEKALQAQAERETAGLYFMFYQDLLEQKAWLTIKNMIQFYTAQKTEKILGTRKFNKILAMTQMELVGGGIGNREIRITDHPASRDELRQESYMRSLFNKERVEIIEVTPESLQQLDFDIKITFEQESTPESERALYLDYIRTMFQLFGQSNIISPQKAFYRIAEKFNENPEDLVSDQISADYEQERFGFTTIKQPQQIGAQKQGQQTSMDMFRSARAGMQNGAQGPGQQMVNQGQTPYNILNQ